MALLIGTKTQSDQTPGGATMTYSHDHTNGLDGFLLVTIAQNDSQSVQGMTYGGVPMVEITTVQEAVIVTRYTAYGLENPPSGVNDVVITFNLGVWNPVSSFAASFTNSGGVGNFINTPLGVAPAVAVVPTSEGSAMYTSAISSYIISDITIDGDSYGTPFDHDGEVNGKRFTGEVGLNLLTAPSTTTSTYTGAPTFHCANYSIEILAAGGVPPVVGNTGTFFQVF